MQKSQGNHRRRRIKKNWSRRLHHPARLGRYRRISHKHEFVASGKQRQFLRSACFDVPPPPGENNTNLKVRNGAFHERHEGKTIAHSPRRIKDKRVPVAAGMRFNQTHQA